MTHDKWVTGAGGYIAVPRPLFRSTVFASEPYTEFQAFLGLVADACWQPRRVRLARGAVDLQRGQLLASTRYLAERWQWPEPRVRRFLNRLSGRRANDAQNDASNDAQNKTQNDALIDAQPTRDGTIITIRNYDTFQKVSQAPTAEIDAQNKPQPDAQNETQFDAPLDPESTQREEIIKTNNNIPFLRNGGELADHPDNVVPMTKGSTSRPEAFAAKLPAIPDPEFSQTPAGTVFGDCRKFLQRAAAMSPDRARRMLGKWCKTYTHGEVIDAVSRAQREGAVDSIAFITGCLRQQQRGQKPTGAMSAITAMEGVEI